MRVGQKRNSDNVNVLVHCRANYLFGPLMAPGIDDFHSRIA
jgi:hypothetical protein